MTLPANERRVARFYDEVRFGLPTDDPAHLELGHHLLGRLGASPDDLKGRRVLEVGTGRGNWSAVLSQSAGSYLGIDLSPESIRFVHDEITPRVVRGNARYLPLPDAAFDDVFCIGVLPAVADDRGVLRELARVLAPGGTIRMMGYGKVQPRNLLRDLVFALWGAAERERQDKVSYQFTRLSGLPLPESVSFQSDQLFAQRDWYFAPIQNRHDWPTLERWFGEVGLRLERLIPYPHARPMRLHEWATRIPLLNRVLSPDWYLVGRRP